MTPFLLIFVFFSTLLIGVPIAFCLGFTGLVGLWHAGVITLQLVPQRIFTGMDLFPLMAIPLFILAGSLMEAGGITQRLITFSNLLVGHFRGGLAHTSIVSSMFISGISGAGVADAAAVGSILIPAMKKEGYDVDFAAAVVAAASVNGPIIPPSITMVVYACTVGVSVGGLFLAGFIPGLFLGLGLMGVVWVLGRSRSFPGRRKRARLREILRGSRDAILALIMPALIMGGILSGIFTATEAAAIAVLYAFLVGTLFYREIRLSQLNRILIDSGLTTSIILFIIGTANILAWVLAAQQVPQRLSAFFLSLGSNPYFILFLVNLFLLLVGMFMETGAAVILLSPILHPALVSLGLHPLHVGLVFVLNLSIGLITPPVGVCLFVSSAIGGISIEKLTRAMLPFMVVEVAVLLLVSFLPQTVLLFPKVFGYA
jgi:tripartite ATP-independent transporter DctM subunit